MERFFDHLAAELARRRFGPEARYLAPSRLLVTPSGAVADLGSVRLRLGPVPTTQWRREIESHLAAVARAEQELQRHSLARWAPLRDRLGLRLVVGPGPLGHVGITIGRGLWVQVIATFDHLTVPILDRHCQAWTRPPGEVAAQARHNTVTAPVARHHRPLLAPDLDATLTVAQGGPFTSGLVAAPERVVAGEARSTFLVAAPNPNTLLAIAPSRPSAVLPERAGALLGHLAGTTDEWSRHDDACPILLHRAGEFAIFTIDTNRRDGQMRR